MDIQRKHLHNLVDIIDTSELETLYHVLMKFIPYDLPTNDEIEAIKVGNMAIQNGDFVNFKDINWD